MKDVKYVTIGGFDFIVTEEINYKGNNYLLAIDENKGDTITFLKTIEENGKQIAVSVDDDEEIEMVLELIKRKNNGENIQ